MKNGKIKRGSKKDTRKAQLHTLEGFAAAFIVLTAMLVAFQSVSITPTSSSTASQQVETQNYMLTEDMLSAAGADGTLKDAILEWNETDASFNGTRSFVGKTPNNDFGDMLEKVLLNQGVAYNVEFACGGSTTSYIRYGDPSMHSVSTDYRITLHSDDEVNNVSKSDNKEPLSEADNFQNSICPEGSENSNLHNILEVRITAWRM